MKKNQIEIQWTEINAFSKGSVFFSGELVGICHGCRYDTQLRRYRTYDLELVVFWDAQGQPVFRRIEMPNQPLWVVLLLMMGFKQQIDFEWDSQEFDQGYDGNYFIRS